MEMFLLWYNVQSFLSVHAFDMGSSRSLPPSLVASSSSVSTPVSGLTATMVAPAPACGAGGSAAMKQDTRVENTDFNHDLFGSYKTSALKSKNIRDKVKSGALPPLPVSKAMLLLPCAWPGSPRVSATGIAPRSQIMSSTLWPNISLWSHGAMTTAIKPNDGMAGAVGA
jgi:hypothetical protein